MKKSLWSLIAIASVAGLLLAGCGSSSKSSSSSSSSAPAASTSTNTGGSTATGATSTSSGSTSTSAGTSTGTSTSTSTGTSGGAAVSANPAVQAAVAQCKKSINAYPQLSAASKSKLDALCDKAATGNVKDLPKVTAEVCQQVIKDTVPAAEQQAALASCPKA